MSIDLSEIEWGTPPPKRAGRQPRTIGLTPGQVAVVAQMRPGEWGSLPSKYTHNAGTFAQRLRECGIDAVSRGQRVYFRADA